MKRAPVAERAVASAVVEYLRDLRWDVHQEVGFPGGPRADIVAVQGNLLWIVEVKTSLSLDLLAQAHRWVGVANHVSAAFPSQSTGKSSRARAFADKIAREHGIGLISVNAEWKGSERVYPILAPRLHRKTSPHSRTSILGQLCEETRTFAEAGNASGRFWSPFKGTVQQIHKALRDKPGLTTKELVEAIGHHYSSDATARSTLPKWLLQGAIEGVEGRGERPMRWYLSERGET